jgi:Skp family chaperone for outer membrane proteins
MKTRAWGLWMGGILLAVLLAPGLAQAQQLAVGLVDTSRIATEYKGMQAFNQQYNDFQREREQKLMDRQRVMMLADADYVKYLDLKQAGAPTESTQKQLTDLEAQAKQREERYRALADKKDRTEEEGKEYDTLNQLYTQRMSEMRALQDSLAKEVQGKREELTKTITTSLDAAIKSIAEAKKFSLVVAKEAMLYGGTDITNEVLEKLNAPAPAAAPK